MAGIGAGIAVAAEPAGSSVALGLIIVGDRLAVVGVTGFLVGVLATAAVLVRRDRFAAVPGTGTSLRTVCSSSPPGAVMSASPPVNRALSLQLGASRVFCR